MSWDIFVQDLPANAENVGEIPDGFEPRPLGRRSEIAARIRAILPSVEFVNPAYGTLDEPGCSVQFHLGSSEIVTSVAVHVYDGEFAPAIVADLLGQLGWRALDPASVTGLFDPSTAEESYARWRDYRGRVTKPKNS